MSIKKLRRDPANGWIAGVCAGLADYFDWNVRALRVVLAIVLLFSGFFPVGLIYLGLWYVLDPVSLADVRESSHTPNYSSPYSSTSRSRATTMTDVQARFAGLEQRLRGMEDCVTSKDFELRRELRKLES